MNEYAGLLEELNFDADDTPSADSYTDIQDPLDFGLKNIDTFMDIVFCIDVTQSMQPTIETVKNFTLSLYDSLVPFMMEKCHRVVKQLRAKVIAFRDFYCDAGMALQESPFFMLPQENSKFKAFVTSLTAKGGGDDPENALEAMAVAMRSDWVKINDLNTQRARHVIVLFTDDCAHRFEQAKEGIDKFYPHPEDMFRSYEDLLMTWQQGSLGKYAEYSMDKRSKRLIVFAPLDLYPWNVMSEDLENAAFLPMEKGGGGIDVAKDIIINTIGGTI